MALLSLRWDRRGRTYQEKHTDLEVLNGRNQLLELKLGKVDHLVSSVCSCMADYYKRVDVALRQQTQYNLRRVVFIAWLFPRIAAWFLVRSHLHNVCYYVPVRDHDPFLLRIVG